MLLGVEKHAHAKKIKLDNQNQPLCKLSLGPNKFQLQMQNPAPACSSVPRPCLRGKILLEAFCFIPTYYNDFFSSSYFVFFSYVSCSCDSPTSKFSVLSFLSFSYVSSCFLFFIFFDLIIISTRSLPMPLPSEAPAAEA
jgi:hypothetical protein